MPGEFPAGSVAVAAAGDALQSTVKARWPDGSARIILLAGRTSLAAGEVRTLQLRSGAAPTAASLTEEQLLSSGYEAVVSFGDKGTVSLRSLVGRMATRSGTRWTGGRVRQWISGPLMSAWTYMSPLGPDAHLTAWFEVRYFGGDQVHILAWLENGYLRVPGCTGHVGRLRLNVQGVSVFDEDVHLANHCRVVAQRGSGVGWTGARFGSPLEIDYPAIYLQATGMVPTTLASVSSSSSLMQRLVREYSPAGFGQVPIRQAGVNPNGNFSSGMGNAGYHPSIGLVPEWDVALTVTGGTHAAAMAVVAHGLGSGRYSIHDRDESTLNPLLFTQYPRLVLNANARAVSSSGAASTNEYTPVSSLTVNSVGQSLGPEAWTSSHHPSVGYTAYLLTGWTYFLEANQFAATLNYLKQTDTAREGAAGIFLTNAGANTTRGAAWALRTLAQALVISPPDEPLAASFQASLVANLRYYHRTNVAQAACPYGVCIPYSNYTPSDQPPRYSHAMWMEDFLTAAWGWMVQLKLMPDAASQGLLEEFFAWKAKSVVGRLGALADSKQFGYNSAAQYTLPVAPTASGQGWLNGAGPWYADWGAIFTAAFGTSNAANTDARLMGAYFPDSTSYWGNLMPAIAYAVEAAVPGAVEAYARMTSAPNWGQFVNACNADPVWGVRPRNPAGRYA